MRILLATAHPYLRELIGGAQQSMHTIALELLEQGHDVAVVSGLAGSDVFGFWSRIKLKLTRNTFVRDQSLGYPVFRSWEPWHGLQEVVDRFQPDIGSPQSGFPVKMASAFRDANVPSLVFVRNLEEADYGGDLSQAGDGYVANSKFTARCLKDRYGLTADVIIPVVDGSRYQTKLDSHRNYVTFINPNPIKGRDIAFEIAEQCPEIEFLFVHSWGLNAENQEILDSFLKRTKNVKCIEPTNDMASIYGVTKILLAPSRCEEAWGRIATEAHFSGIPVIATDIGGLPEAVGPGGITLPLNAPASDWAIELRRLLNDVKAYESLSAAALTYSKREQLDCRYLVKEFVRVCDHTIERYRQRQATAI